VADSLIIGSRGLVSPVDRPLAQAGLCRLQHRRSPVEERIDAACSVVDETQQAVLWMEELILALPNGERLVSQIPNAPISKLVIPLAARAELGALVREATEPGRRSHLELVQVAANMHDCRWRLKCIEYVLERYGLINPDVQEDSFNVARNHYFDVATKHGYAIDLERSIEGFLDRLEVDFVQWLVEMRLYHGLQLMRDAEWFRVRQLDAWVLLQQRSEASASQSSRCLGAKEELQLDSRYLSACSFDTRLRAASLFGAICSIRLVRPAQVAVVLIEAAEGKLFSGAARQRYIEGLMLNMSIVDKAKLQEINDLLLQNPRFSDGL